MAEKLTPHFADVQAHYDLSDDFFRLFLDPTQTYSCAYFERDDMTLEEAQLDSPRSKRVLLNGWEQFDEPVDRIVSIGAFEHFGHDRYDDFFALAHRILPTDGVMLLHTITGLLPEQCTERGIPLTFEMARFIKFIVTEIFPGGRLPSIEKVADHSAKAGFRLTRRQSLQPHYARTLDLWAEALEAHRDEAIEIQSEEVYERYIKYLTGCANAFRTGYIDVNQFTLEK
jgi:cyclopropane-fatty-acyl-phospholipid synthase